MAQVILFNPSNGVLLDKMDIWPPWPLIYISVKVHKEYSIKIIDGRFDKDWKKLLDIELNDNTLCVGVTALTGLQLKYAVEFLEEVKNRKPSIKTVMGGIHVTPTYQDSIKEPFVDFVVRGDGEDVFYNLVKAIDNDDPYENIKGISFKDSSGVPISTPVADFVNLNDLGELPLHLINDEIERYIPIEKGFRKLIIFSSRGCSLGCAYCHDTNEFNLRRWRYLSAENTIDFLKMLMKKYKINYFIFQDDNFWQNKGRVEKFILLLERNKMSIKWGVYGAPILSLKNYTYEDAQRLKSSGLEKILSGIESVSPKIQKIIRKPVDINDVYKVNRNFSKAEIKMIYSFMSGFPTETNDDLKLNIDSMLKIKKQTPSNDIGNMKPLIFYPGTPLYDWAINNGFKPPKTFIEWSAYSWSNYDVLPYPWLSLKRKQFLQNIYFTTLMLNPDYEYINSVLWIYICKLLYPISHWRAKNLYFRFSPTLTLFNYMKKLNLF